MNVATRRPLSAVDLNFNPARFPLGRLAEFAREHWGVEGELTPLDGERDQSHRVNAADGASYVLKVSAAGESEGAVDFQVAALRHLERHAPELPVPRVIASRAGKDLESIAAADGARHTVRVLEACDVKVKLVERGYGPTTRFAASAGSRIDGLVPEAYAPFAQRVFSAYVN